MSWKWPIISTLKSKQGFVSWSTRCKSWHVAKTSQSLHTTTGHGYRSCPRHNNTGLKLIPCPLFSTLTTGIHLIYRGYTFTFPYLPFRCVVRLCHLVCSISSFCVWWYETLIPHSQRDRTMTYFPFCPPHHTSSNLPPLLTFPLNPAYQLSNLLIELEICPAYPPCTHYNIPTHTYTQYIPIWALVHIY